MWEIGVIKKENYRSIAEVDNIKQRYFNWIVAVFFVA
jgi:hypothetical protein